MSGIFTDRQFINMQRGYHPDCCDADQCSACGASEVNLQACRGKASNICQRLWRAAIRHDHNADPERVLVPDLVNDAALLDEAARALWLASAEVPA